MDAISAAHPSESDQGMLSVVLEFGGKQFIACMVGLRFLVRLHFCEQISV